MSTLIFSVLDPFDGASPLVAWVVIAQNVDDDRLTNQERDSARNSSRTEGTGLSRGSFRQKGELEKVAEGNSV